MRIALGQFNPCLGDIEGNIESIKQLYKQAVGFRADMLILPELCVCGYPPEDLLLRKHFVEENLKAVESLARTCSELTLLVGFAEPVDGKCFNSVAVLSKGRIESIYRKIVLPNYGVFDEKRYFEPGSKAVCVNVAGINVALTICEDIWELDTLKRILDSVADKQLIVNISSSPFHSGKISLRYQALTQAAKHFDCPIAYCNLVGGQDELVFGGRSMLVDSSGVVLAQAAAFQEDLLVADITQDAEGSLHMDIIKAACEKPRPEQINPLEEIYSAMVTGTRDYVTKNGFTKVLLGFSGGIDSSVAAAIAADALGAENVVGVTMPTRFNSPETIADAKNLAENLNIEFHTIPVELALDEFSKTLSALDGWNESGLAYENLQARIRGCILMSMSNQFSYLVLTTGNKSETAVGYSTLYGDTAGGFAVLKDVPKTIVYGLAEHINKINNKAIIARSVIERPPSAELREDQKDSDSLPDYELLDKILKGYIEEDKSFQQLVADKLPAETVKRVIAMVDHNEHKRRQCPPGVKITPKAFGRDRRMPITNRYTSH